MESFGWGSQVFMGRVLYNDCMYFLGEKVEVMGLFKSDKKVSCTSLYNEKIIWDCLAWK